MPRKKKPYIPKAEHVIRVYDKYTDKEHVGSPMEVLNVLPYEDNGTYTYNCWSNDCFWGIKSTVFRVERVRK